MTGDLQRAVWLLMQTDDYTVVDQGEGWAELHYVHNDPPHPVTRIEVRKPEVVKVVDLGDLVDVPYVLENRMVAVQGVTIDGVWFPYPLLFRLAGQKRYDSDFGEAFIDADPDQERVLLAHNLAVKETRGGLHSSEPARLHEFMARLELEDEN